MLPWTASIIILPYYDYFTLAHVDDFYHFVSHLTANKKPHLLTELPPILHSSRPPKINVQGSKVRSKQKVAEQKKITNGQVFLGSM